MRRRRGERSIDARPRVAVLIPAHNEAAVIGKTLARLMATMQKKDRVLVVADNCSDDTAAIARTIGAEVVERRNTDQRGKAYALEFGMDHLASDPPEVVVVLDADCAVERDLVRLISNRAYVSNRPVQCRNLSIAGKQPAATHAVSELGFRFKNLVRPLGMARLGLPCHLMGTGMAIPWDVFRSANLVGDHLAEDMQLGIELALRGYPALLCPEVGITSLLPDKDDAFLSQRTRWEQGHLRTSLTQVPRLLARGLLRRNLGLLCLGLDLIVPPLSLLVAVWASAVGLLAFAGFCGTSWVPAAILASGGVAMLLSVLAGWFTFCRRAVPFRSLLAIPAYVFRKLPIYLSYFTGRKQKEWVRTDREQNPHESLPCPAPNAGSEVAAASETGAVSRGAAPKS